MHSGTTFPCTSVFSQPTFKNVWNEKSVSQKYIWSQTINFWSVGIFFRMCFFSLVWCLQPTQCRYRRLLFRLTRIQSVGFLLTRDRPVAATCTWQNIILIRDKRRCSRRDSQPAIRSSERPQTYTLEHADTEIGSQDVDSIKQQVL